MLAVLIEALYFEGAWSSGGIVSRINLHSTGSEVICQLPFRAIFLVFCQACWKFIYFAVPIKQCFRFEVPITY